MKSFNTIRAFTHNIVLSEYEGKEYILIGKGIGFNIKADDIIHESQCNSFYHIQDVNKLSKYEQMILNTDEKVLLITEQAISLAEEKLDYKFGETLHMSLLDHINFAIYRYENRLEVDHFMSDEYYLMYSDLYDIAQKMVALINAALDINLPHSEVGSIILHLHAGLRQGNVSTSAYYSMIITRALGYLSEREGKEILDNSLARARLITHLKFALKRTGDGVNLNNPLIEIFKDKYQDYFTLASDLAIVLKEEFDIDLPESEIGYIALHIYNLKHS